MVKFYNPKLMKQLGLVDNGQKSIPIGFQYQNSKKKELGKKQKD